MASFRGQKKAWATPRLVSFRGLIQNFRRASPRLQMRSPPIPPPHPQGQLERGAKCFSTKNKALTPYY